MISKPCAVNSMLSPSVVHNSSAAGCTFGNSVGLTLAVALLVGEAENGSRSRDPPSRFLQHVLPPLFLLLLQQAIPHDPLTALFSSALSHGAVADPLAVLFPSAV